mmetsp:Transcript_66275/g.205338  ORF Transcript_66275/g.205338 Transcript_66275/m.205338 type:complete len:284 (-) Transcript_66275:323-1174(-)
MPLKPRTTAPSRTGRFWLQKSCVRIRTCSSTRPPSTSTPVRAASRTGLAPRSPLPRPCLLPPGSCGEASAGHAAVRAPSRWVLSTRAGRLWQRPSSPFLGAILRSSGHHGAAPALGLRPPMRAASRKEGLYSMRLALGSPRAPGSPRGMAFALTAEPAQCRLLLVLQRCPAEGATSLSTAWLRPWRLPALMLMVRASRWRRCRPCARRPSAPLWSWRTPRARTTRAAIGRRQMRAPIWLLMLPRLPLTELRSKVRFQPSPFTSSKPCLTTPSIGTRVVGTRFC